jgi:hypothetical protein
MDFGFEDSVNNYYNKGLISKDTLEELLENK